MEEIMAKNTIDISKLNIPKHVAIILDGNGRWAKKRMMPRNYGHAKGAKVDSHRPSAPRRIWG